MRSFLFLGAIGAFALPSPAAADVESIPNGTFEECILLQPSTDVVSIENFCEIDAVVEISSEDGVCAEQLCQFMLPAVTVEEVEEVSPASSLDISGCMADVLASGECKLRSQQEDLPLLPLALGGTPRNKAEWEVFYSNRGLACFQFERVVTLPGDIYKAFGKNVCVGPIVVAPMEPDCGVSCNWKQTILPGEGWSIDMASPDQWPRISACQVTVYESGDCEL